MTTTGVWRSVRQRSLLTVTGLMLVLATVVGSVFLPHLPGHRTPVIPMGRILDPTLARRHHEHRHASPALGGTAAAPMARTAGLAIVAPRRPVVHVVRHRPAGQSAFGRLRCKFFHHGC